MEEEQGEEEEEKGEEEEGEEEGEEGGEEEGEEGEQGAADEPGELPEVRRHVLLFNCWPDAPPSPDGKTDSAEAAKTGVPEAYEDATLAPCAPRERWVTRAFEQPPDSATASSSAVVARLMGTPRRRGSAMRFRADEVAAPKSALRQALCHADAPHAFRLK